MRTSHAVLVVSVLAATSADAFAQDRPPQVKDVFVRSTDGVEVRAQLLDLGPSSLSLFVDGTRREVPLATVDRIQTRGDSVRNGALIGAAIGAGLFGMAAAEYGGQVLPMVVGAAVGYGLIGAGVDAIIPGRTTIFSRPTASSAPPGGKRAGLALKVGF